MCSVKLTTLGRNGSSLSGLVDGHPFLFDGGVLCVGTVSGQDGIHNVPCKTCTNALSVVSVF